MISFILNSKEVLGLVIGGFIISFTMSVGMGANDVANAFGTSYGAKIMNILQIIIVASFFEVIGAILIGEDVTNTLRTGIVYIESIFENYRYSKNCIHINKTNLTEPIITYYLKGALGCPEMILMIGSVSSLIGSSIWMIFANIVSLPVSTTHSIVGSLIGYGFVSLKGAGINWKKLINIIISWFISPFASGLLSIVVWLFIYHMIIKKKKADKIGLKFLPFFYFLTVSIILFSILFKGSSFLHLDQLHIGLVIMIPLLGGLIAATLVLYFLLPYLERRFSSLNQTNDAYVTYNRETVDNLETNIDINQENLDGTVIISSKPHSEDPAQFKNDYKNDDQKIILMFRYLQIMVACYGSFAHGGNDISNSVAPVANIWILYSNKEEKLSSNYMIFLLGYGSLGVVLGLAVWGKRVLKTVGQEITSIQPSMAFSIELGSVLTVLLLTRLGIPVSTTHCKIGSVILLGWVRYGKESVKLKLIVKILLSWFVTVPVSGAISALSFYLIRGTIFGFS